MTDRPEDMPYEQARDELIAVVQKLETGGTGLEELLAMWERGEELAAICQRWLDGARERLERASSPDQDGAGQEDTGQEEDSDAT